MMLQSEIESGLDRMKFSMNHYHRFDNAWIAFLAGFLQATSIIVVEIVNFVVILTTENIMEVVMNFMACAVIAVFDNAFYSALGPSEFKKLVEDPGFEDLYKITRTSSRNARRRPVGAASPGPLNPIDDDTILKTDQKKVQDICVVFSELGPVRKLLKLVYKGFRVLYISVWFYFLPFLALLGSYVVPYIASLL
jgi:hypothetical protein